jgi:uncharacterized DUF497 family protein
MDFITWDVAKNNKLKEERNVSFEDVIFSIEQGKILDIIRHPNKEKYPGQNLLIVEINNYAYLVPFIESSNEIFLKTIIPSRKATKKYLRKKNDKK